MKLLRIIQLNLILEWDGLLRILNKEPDVLSQADADLFISGHQKTHYVLNWIVWKIKFWNKK